MMKVLVVDDIQMNRKVLSKLLGREYEMLEAENGKQVLEILETENIDVVILDIVMPEMSGITVLEEMKKRPEWQSVGVLVATSQKEQTERMVLSAGADDVVSKPYDPIVIRQRINNIVAKKELEKMQEKDVKGISAEERKFVDTTLFSMRETCEAMKENSENISVVTSLANFLNDEVNSLIELLTTKEGY